MSIGQLITCPKHRYMYDEREECPRCLQERAGGISYIALKILLANKPGAALNAVREDHKDFAKLVDNFRKELKCQRKKKSISTK